MARTALVETATGKVVNVIELEPGADWQPPEDHQVEAGTTAGIGDTWDGQKFIRPPEPEPEPPSRRDILLDKLKASDVLTAAETAEALALALE